MRYSRWKEGTRAVKDVPLPINRAPGDERESPKIGLKPFTGDTQLRVLQEAREMAIAKGVADPKPGDPIYNFAQAVFTVLHGTVDPEDHETEFFADVGELLGASDVGPDSILMLADDHSVWQEEVSPQIGKLDEDDFARYMLQIAGPEGERFFHSLRPGVQWILVRTMVAQLLNSLISRSLSGPSESAPSAESPNGTTSDLSESNPPEPSS